MRWIVLIVGMLAVSGCAFSAARERHERTAQWFKEWLWKSGDSSSPQSYSDKSMAHHEQTTI